MKKCETCKMTVKEVADDGRCKSCVKYNYYGGYQTKKNDRVYDAPQYSEGPASDDDLEHGW
jgi:hypothetical protein